jgi:hypothetical protein
MEAGQNMNRRTFLKLLAAIPLAGIARPEPAPASVPFVSLPTGDATAIPTVVKIVEYRETPPELINCRCYVGSVGEWQDVAGISDVRGLWIDKRRIYP